VAESEDRDAERESSACSEIDDCDSESSEQSHLTSIYSDSSHEDLEKLEKTKRQASKFKRHNNKKQLEVLIRQELRKSFTKSEKLLRTLTRQKQKTHIPTGNDASQSAPADPPNFVKPPTSIVFSRRSCSKPNSRERDGANLLKVPKEQLKSPKSLMFSIHAVVEQEPRRVETKKETALRKLSEPKSQLSRHWKASVV